MRSDQPEDIDICPKTGKPIGISALGGSGENLFANLRQGMAPNERESVNDSISFLEPVGVMALSSRILQSNVVHSSIVVILADK